MFIPAAGQTSTKLANAERDKASSDLKLSGNDVREPAAEINQREIINEMN